MSPKMQSIQKLLQMEFQLQGSFLATFLDELNETRL